LAVAYSSWAGKEIVVALAHPRRVDREAAAVIELDDHDLEEIAGTIRAEHERSAWLVVPFLERAARERMSARMANVRVSDSMLLAAW